MTADLTPRGERLMDVADAMDALEKRLRDADSITMDVPVLSELFHRARTSGKNPRDGRFVALFDYFDDTGWWECRSVAWLQTGTHYRDTTADLVLSYKPHPLLSTEEFSSTVASAVERKAQGTRQNAYNYRKDIQANYE